MRTVDEVGDDMPEMQLCDGNCGRMVMVADMTKLKCNHAFCSKCLAEAEKDHLHCTPPTAETIMRLTQHESETDTEASADENITVIPNCRRVVFEYDGQLAVLWLRPRMTYVQLAEQLGAVFGIPQCYKITFTFNANASVTGAESTSPPMDVRMVPARIPTSGVVLVTAAP